MRANEFITELFSPDKAVPFEWGTDWEDQHSLEIPLPNGKLLNIEFEPDIDLENDDKIKAVEIKFWVDDTAAVTGGGNANQIFATVIEAIKRYLVKTRGVRRLVFTAAEKSRARMYDTIAKRTSAQLGWHVVPFEELMSKQKYEPYRTASGYSFVIEKGKAPESRQAAQKPQHGDFKDYWWVYVAEYPKLPIFKITGGTEEEAIQYVIQNRPEFKAVEPNLVKAININPASRSSSRQIDLGKINSPSKDD